MSISSLAQDSALRLISPPATLEQIAGAAANAALAAKDAGLTENEAIQKGETAAKLEGAGKAAAVPSGPLAQLVRYIPTETIALYIAVAAALGDISAPQGKEVSDADFTSRWIWFWVMTVMTAALAVGLSYRAQKEANPDADFKWPMFEAFAASAAFAVWSLALPSTPLRDYAGFDYSVWNGVIILAGTLVIATLAHIFGKVVSWEKVVETT